MARGKVWEFDPGPAEPMMTSRVFRSSALLMPVVCQTEQVSTSSFMLPMNVNFRLSNFVFASPTAASRNVLDASRPIAVPSLRASPYTLLAATMPPPPGTYWMAMDGLPGMYRG